MEEQAPWILLAEDDEGDQMLVQRAIKRSGLGVRLVLACDGVEALDILRREKRPPAVVLLDQRMPRVSGIEVLRTIRDDEVLAKVPVVILAGTTERVKELYDAGANSVLCKPCDYDQTIELAATTIRYWLQANSAFVL